MELLAVDFSTGKSNLSNIFLYISNNCIPSNFNHQIFEKTILHVMEWINLSLCMVNDCSVDKRLH